MMNQEQIEELIDRSRQNDTIAFAQLREFGIRYSL